ncbi:MAG TPA: hypothetical protein DDY68_04040 [Porphyromonadaceae bacterium]|nr:hypothetical protein [Porphyromonadaceae bacterium]
MNKQRWIHILLMLISALIISSIVVYFYVGGAKGLFFSAMGGVLVLNLVFSLFFVQKYRKG